MRTILAIDPGREKCGLAVVTGARPIHMEVVSREEIVSVAGRLASEHSAEVILVGNGTGGTALAAEVRASGTFIPIELIDEAGSSLRARTRYFEENPPRGIRRLIPRGLLVPPRPYDDYVALILAEDYLGTGSG